MSKKMRLQLLVMLMFSVQIRAEDIKGQEVEPEIIDLYGKDEAVAHMDHTNFHSQLHGKPYIWAVEFYNSWCGHCQLYAPTWRRIAEQTANWNQVVRVGAINCARPENLATCREYDIGGYPWVKLFKPRSKPGDQGEETRHKGLDEMLTMLVNYATELQNKTHPPRWPNLAPFSGSVAELLSSPEPLVALVVEGPQESAVGRQVVLDLSPQRQRLLVVRTAEPPAGLTLTEPGRPALLTYVRLGRAGGRQQEPEVLVSRDGLPPRKLFSDALRRHLGLAAEAETEAAGEQPPPPPPPSSSAAVADSVFMVDLENAIGYAFTHEVAGKRQIAGEPLAALRNFTGLLVDQFPGRRSVMRALGAIHDLVKSRDAISGAELERHLQTTEHRLPAQRGWLGCRGSEARYRGYTCGLWSLFHTLTVQAMDKGNAKPSVLPAIHGYVKHFFSCSHCSQHFQEMAEKVGLFNVTRADEATIWLWKAHNMVNRRLAGDLTEDPQHPKVQFPTRQQCRACFEGDEYYLAIVLSFLRNFYGQDVIRLDGLTEQEAAAASTGKTTASDVLQPSESEPVRSAGSRNRVESVARVLAGDTASSRPAIAGYFTGTDISLCVLLWVFSFVTLGLAFLLFRMKRKYKRKHSKDVRSLF